MSCGSYTVKSYDGGPRGYEAYSQRLHSSILWAVAIMNDIHAISSAYYDNAQSEMQRSGLKVSSFT